MKNKLLFLTYQHITDTQCNELSTLANHYHISTDINADVLKENSKLRKQVLSRVLLRYGLASAYQLSPDDFRITTLGKGKFDISSDKSTFKDNPLPTISLSHDTHAEAAYLSHSPSTATGVDIEGINRHCEWKKLSQRYFSKKVGNWIQRQTDPNQAFIHVWTLTEALVKALGVGLKNQMSLIDFELLDGRISLSPTQSIDDGVHQWIQRFYHVDDYLITTVMGTALPEHTNRTWPKIESVSMENLLDFYHKKLANQ